MRFRLLPGVAPQSNWLAVLEALENPQVLLLNCGRLASVEPVQGPVVLWPRLEMIASTSALESTSAFRACSSASMHSLPREAQCAVHVAPTAPIDHALRACGSVPSSSSSSLDIREECRKCSGRMHRTDHGV